MSKIDTLISQLCPEGVKKVRLGDCCDFKRGSTITAKDAVEGDIPVIAGGQKPAYYHNIANRIGETITVAGSGAYAGFVAYWNQPIYVSDAFTVSPKNDGLMVKYVYYFLVNIQEKIHNTKKGSGVPHVHPSSIDNFTIPLPPLPIQEEIVKILDRFAVLTAELEAELEARRKQYEYYRTLLLDFSEGKKQAYEGQSDPRTRLLSFDSVSSSDSVRWMQLGEVATIARGVRVVKSELGREGYPVYQNCLSPMGFYKEYNYPANTTFIISAGAAGKIGFSDYPYWAADDCLNISCNEKLNSKYLYYYMLSQQKYFDSRVRHASIPRLSRDVVETFTIPIPPLSEQERIVNILDKFDQLVNGVKDSIPALIDDVQKQYEYYRNKLLTFPE